MATAKISQEYVPGVCNIGPAERRQRRMMGIYGSIVTVGLFLVLFSLDINALWRLLLIIPATIAANGFLQDRMHFCVGFGMKGIFNVINSAGVTDNVELEAFRLADRRKAIQIVLYSLAIALAVTALTLLV